MAFASKNRHRRSLQRLSLSSRWLRFEPLEDRLALSATSTADTGFETYATPIFYADNVAEVSSAVDLDVSPLDVVAEPLTVPRGRPTLNVERTTFVADNGQLLRGPFTSTEWTSAVPSAQIAAMRNLGFNAVHLYAEVFDPNYVSGVPGSGRAPGYAVAEVDKIVNYTRDLGMYLVMTIGNGANNGNYNQDYVVDFWSFYAERYKDATHVVFEVQNEPVAWSAPYSSPTANPTGALDMEVVAYNTIRAHAPNTPVLLFTYAVIGGTSGANNALTDIHLFNQQVFGNQNAVWTNEAVGLHGYGGWKGTSETIAALIAAGYPCFMTEYSTEDWGGHAEGVGQELTAELERLDVSWTTFQHIPPTGVAPDVSQPESYKNLIELAGISWTPDYGTWPMARGPYGNGGLPRQTTGLSGSLRIQAEDFDTGGEDVTYNDTDTANLGGAYRTGEGVDIVATSDTGGGYTITSTAAGEWLEYTILVQEPGFYNLGLRYASTSAGSVQLDSYGQDRTGSWTLASTGSSQTWATATRQVFLEYGLQKLRLNITGGAPDINWLELLPVSAGAVPNGTYKIVNRNSGQAAEADTLNNLLTQNTYSGANTQRWNLVNRGAGQYSIGSVASSSRYWSTFYNGDGDSVDLNYWGYDGSADRRFLLVPNGDGFYSILVVDGGLGVEVAGASTATGENIQQYEYLGGVQQEWAILAPSAQLFPTQLVTAWGDPNAVPGDYDSDNNVAGTDFLVWQRGFGSSVTPGSGADGSNDGSVDGDDLQVWSSSYGHTAESSWVQLSWAAASGATSYSVKRANTSGGPYTTVATGITGTSFSDTGLPGGVGYYYVVSAVGTGGESLNSIEADVTATREPLADTYVRDGWGDGIHGAETILAIKNDGGTSTGFNRISFLKFDVTGLDNADRVTLKLTPYQVDGNATLTYELVTNDTWSETTTRWTNQPAGSGTVLAGLSGYVIGQQIEIDVTAVARSEAAGDGILSLKVSEPSPSAIFVGFHSREVATRSLRPVIEYTLGTSQSETSVFQAEAATLSGVAVATSNPGYFGTGYADFDALPTSGSYIEWSVPAGQAGDYDLAFRYALGDTTSRPLELRVNGVIISPSLGFSPSGSWSTWQELVIAAPLVAGTNTIRITTNGSSGGNFDQLTVAPTFASGRFTTSEEQLATALWSASSTDNAIEDFELEELDNAPDWLDDLAAEMALIGLS